MGTGLLGKGLTVRNSSTLMKSHADHAGKPGIRFLIFEIVWSFTCAAHGPSTVRRLLDAVALMSAERLVTPRMGAPPLPHAPDRRTRTRSVLTPLAVSAEGLAS
jgi:hypothetical protein